MTPSNLAPVAVFCYNRPEHLKRTINSLKNNSLASQSVLYIFSDAAKSPADLPQVEAVRYYINTISGFKRVVVENNKQNFGLAQSIIHGVSKVINEHGKIIVLEDDLVVSTDFLDYMNNALNFYELNRQIFSISGYSATEKLRHLHDKTSFFHYRINSWGWASWKDRWHEVDWEVSDFKSFIKSKNSRQQFNRSGTDSWSMLMRQQIGEINSWAIRFNYACFKADAVNLYPTKSKVQNQGTDGSGTHVRSTTKFDTRLSTEKVDLTTEIFINEPLIAAYNQKLFNQSLLRRTINRLKRWYYFRT